MNTVSSELPDWSRETPRRFWDPGRRLIRAIRKYQAWLSRGGSLSWLPRRYWVLQHRFWSIVTGAEIDLRCQIAGGLMIPHPNGIVIHPKAKIGPNCLIFQQVTIGTGRGINPPTLGGHVDVGAGAKIIGDIKIGDHTIIGANAVVLADVPAGATVAGIPARIIDQR